MSWTDQRRSACVRLPEPCAYCGGDVYSGMEGVDGAACARCLKPKAPAGKCPACGVICAEGVEH